MSYDVPLRKSTVSVWLSSLQRQESRSSCHGELGAHQALAARWSNSSLLGVRVAHDGDEGQVQLGRGEGGAVNNDPRSPLVRGLEVVGEHGHLVHDGVAVGAGALSGVGSSASLDGGPVESALGGAVRSHRGHTGLPESSMQSKKAHQAGVFMASPRLWLLCSIAQASYMLPMHSLFPCWQVYFQVPSAFLDS